MKTFPRPEAYIWQEERINNKEKTRMKTIHQQKELKHTKMSFMSYTHNRLTRRRQSRKTEGSLQLINLIVYKLY